jgi:hypothetical protein
MNPRAVTTWRSPAAALGSMRESFVADVPSRTCRRRRANARPTRFTDCRGRRFGRALGHRQCERRRRALLHDGFATADDDDLPSAASLMVPASEAEGCHLPPRAMNRVAASRTFSSCFVLTRAGSSVDSARAHCRRVNMPESVWSSSSNVNVANVLRTTRIGAPPTGPTIRLAIRTRCPARTGTA